MPKFGDSRVMFSLGEQTKFVKQFSRKEGLTLNNLANTANVSVRTIGDWKREKYHIPEKMVYKFCKKYKIKPPNNINQLKSDWLKFRTDICRKGAISRYKIYGNFSTLEGRRKGGSHTLRILRDRGIIAPCKNFSTPSIKNAKLAEFFGIILGDGSLSKFQLAITLNSEADKDYVNYVIRLTRQLFKDKPSLIYKKDCKAVDIRLSGLNLVKFLVKNGLQLGDKVKNQVGVPEWILKSKLFRIECLRGLMDTDGCIARCTHHYKNKNYTYYNPCFANRSKPLLRFVTQTLDELHLHPSVAGERIWLYNKASVRDYFKIVGSNNFRLLRYKESIPIGSGESLLNFDA